MMRLTRLLLAVGILSGCARPGEPPPRRDARAAASGTSHPADQPAPEHKGSKTAPVSIAPDAKLAIAPDEDLKLEEQEANPYSETVALKLSVSPPVKAVVMWGAKQMAKLTPGQMETELVRPRGSGPLDLDIRADGFLPHHTRLYADRSDKVNVRLYRVEEAPGLFGYKRAPVDKAP
jgi:hypothetical protein